MRITVVSPHLPTPAFSMRGVRHSEQLRLFAEAGHAVRAVVPLAWAPWRHPPREELDGGVVVSHPRYFSFSLANRQQSPGLVGEAKVALDRLLFARAAERRLDRPDVVLAHSATFPGGLLGRLGGASFVVTLHDNELFELAPESDLVRRLVARTLQQADCAVYVSEVLRQHGLSVAGPHENRVIPIGIDTFDDLERAVPSRFTICCVTRLISRKRVDRLIRAFGRLAAERPETRLVVVGDGPERRPLESLARTLRLEDKIDFTGQLDRRAALTQIARSSVMALPSVMESLGAVYLEAMSLGVPALATAGEGIAAYIENGIDGILVPAGDDQQLHAELRALARDPERAKRIGDAGRRRFLASGPSWRANVAAHLALFDELRRKRREAA
jgi:glycosyltransferase involved in cell wall biosynthesis